jgi:hypothetical protein
MGSRTIRMSLVAVAVFACSRAIASASSVVLPVGNTTTEGNTTNNNSMALPFDCNFTGFANTRMQQVYLGSEVGSGTITEVRFRPNATGGTAGGAFSSTVKGVTMTLSTTSKAPDGLSSGSTALLDSNVGADVTTVFSGDLALSSAATGGPPRDFDIVVTLQTPFPFDSSQGNLLMDVTIPDCTKAITTLFDAQSTTSDSVSRVGVIGTIFFTDADSAGLVTQFTIAAALPVSPAPALSAIELIVCALLLLLGGVRGARHRSSQLQ